MLSRRNMLKATLGAGSTVFFYPASAKAGHPASPSWFTGFRAADGSFGIAQISSDLSVQPLLITRHRLHDISVSPDAQVIVAPARRPGTDLHIFHLQTGQHTMVTASRGRHFFGHGAFSADGRTWFACENDYDAERGVIGIYDVTDGFRRTGEFPSGGIGPHELVLHPDGQSLIIANGGIVTHPDTGRAKLNLASMRPNLTRISLGTATVLNTVALPHELFQLSLRHLDIAPDGTVAVGAQDQNKARLTAPLVWTWNSDNSPQSLTPMPTPAPGWQAFKGYIGSVRFNARGDTLAATSPRGGLAYTFGKIVRQYRLEDVCGLAQAPEGFLLTSGTGRLCRTTQFDHQAIIQTIAFDNHCT